MRDTLYHSLLRISVVTVALLLMFDSGILSPVTRTLSDNTITYLANSVGVYAGVESNEVSELTAQLTARERELEAREAALRDREITARSFETDAGANISTYVLSVFLFILTSLIVINYVLDFTRSRRQTYVKAT